MLKFLSFLLGAQPVTNSGIDDVTAALISDSKRYDNARSILQIFHPIICVFGLLGNILILLILTRKRLKMSIDGTEWTVHIGLTALAVSDFMVCLVVLPYGLLNNSPFSFPTRTFHLVYETYGNAFINTFILTSTWLTVTMATSRYLAICHPFKARHLIGITGTKTSIALVFIVSVMFNIPRFLEWRIESVQCFNGNRRFFKIPGYIEANSRANTVYIWVYFTVGIFLPLAALAFCNICLIKALRQSVKIRRRYRVPVAHADSNYRITSILVTIVVMYIVLVAPAEMLLFIQGRLSKSRHSAPALVLAVEITNLLQMINFSCNFVLYFILNVHFRRGLRDIFCACAGCGKHQDKSSSIVSNSKRPWHTSPHTTQSLL